MASFGDGIMRRVRGLGHPLCAGIDPHIDRIPEMFRQGEMSVRDPRTVTAVEAFITEFIERFVGRVPIIKPQIAFFEQLGSPGIALLERLVQRARSLDSMVLLDAKRGDIGSTAEAYARAYLDAGAACEVDAITLNAYLGLDTLEPFVRRARDRARGLFVLAKTSNPGSGDLQDQLVEDEPVYALMARALAPLASELAGPETGWSSLGVVVGATYPEQGERIRALLPSSIFLIPGYGAQGGSAEDAVRSFVRGPSGREGGLVNSSRGLMFPDAAVTAGSAREWERAIDEALDRTIDELGNAVAR